MQVLLVRLRVSTGERARARARASGGESGRKKEQSSDFSCPLPDVHQQHCDLHTSLLVAPTTPFVAPCNPLAKLLIDYHCFLRLLARIRLQVMHRTTAAKQNKRKSETQKRNTQPNCFGHPSCEGTASRCGQTRCDGTARCGDRDTSYHILISRPSR